MRHCLKFNFILFIFFSVPVAAQQSGRIETDRPDYTESPYTVPKHWFQSETGFNIETNRSGYRLLIHPTMLNKYGIGKKFELRLITEVVSVETPLVIPDGNENITGLRPVVLGGKVALLDEKGIRPKTSLLFHTSIPRLASEKLRQSKIAPEIRLLMQNRLSKRFNLGYNIGAIWDGVSNHPKWLISLETDFYLTEKLSLYAEIYNIVRFDEHPINNVDGGFMFKFTPNIQLDLSYGYGLNPHAYFGHYFALGFSFRVPAGKNSAN